MGADASKGISNAWSGMKQGLGAWFDPKTRSSMLGQIARKLPTLHEDIQRNAAEVSPGLGLVAKTASGLLKTIPQAKLAESLLGNIANNNLGAAAGNVMDARKSDVTGVPKLDLAKAIGREVIKGSGKPAAPGATSMSTMSAMPSPSMGMPAPVKTESKPALTIADIRPASQSKKDDDDLD
jgi:hypothetical protein